MKSRLGYIISFWFLAQIAAIGQEYTIASFTSEDGLPTNYCFNIVEDTTGFIWIATEAGLCTFDGQFFQTSPYPELAKKEITRVLKDDTGRIWFNELSGNVYYLDDGQIKEYVYPKELTNSNRVEICTDNFGHLWIAEDNGFGIVGINIETLEREYTFTTFREQFNLLSELDLITYPENSILRNDSIFYTIKGEEFKSAAFNIYQFHKDLEYYDEEFDIFIHNNDFYTYNRKSGVVLPILLQFKSQLEHKTQGFKIDKYGSLWIATRNGVLRIQDPLSHKAKVTKYFPEQRIGSVLIDKENNIWIATQDNGIRKFSETRIHSIKDEKDRSITNLIRHYNYLIYLTATGNIVVLDDNENVVFDDKTNLEIDYAYDCDIIDETKLLITTNTSLYILDLANMEIQQFRDMRSLKSASIKEDKIWLNAGHANYITYFGEKKLYRVPPHKRSYAVFPISSEEAYLGTISGLYRTNSVTLKTEPICSEIIDDYIKSIEKASDGSLWIGTYGNGIYILNNDTISHHILDLPSAYINEITQNKDEMWVGSNNGLFKISKVNNEYNIKILDKSDGLISSEIRAINIKNGIVSVAGGKGISVLDQNIKFNKDIPVLKIDNVKINERDTTILNSYNLEVEQRNVKINFGGILLNNPGSVAYKFKMQGVDKDWIITNQNTAQYPSLPPGKYHFLLSAKSSNSSWSPLKKVSFQIPKRPTESQWFKALVLLAVCCLLFFGYSYYSQILETRRQYKMMQMTALRAQMNPHFIFNSLNSVQDYVLRDDKRAANKYIAKFSKLMRYILNASDKEFTNLKDELVALDLYLSIESMRFDNTLKYNIDVEKSIDQKIYKIPTMILQPYLENAIKHGLMHSQGEKLISLKVKKLNSGLHFEIADNGIGRENAQKINVENRINHDSKGTSINQKRIELLNKSFQNENKVTFEDLYDKDRNPAGTKVEIFLQSIKILS